ncbi:uncharacterized protein LOC132272848 [Cornus florida]|uniref:uncharacterized protein LOC132272848 n=1 Tax=Cornus florida TaxID=4283 RepID=UPI00289B9E3A|nr:uncharacterized protein LOC132272848 [Cornus florida]
MVQKTNLAFSQAVMSCPLPSKSKMPTLESFDGMRDPLNHLDTYKALMYLQAVPGEIMCRAFPTTLKGWARFWFNKLKPGSIENFEELSKQFIGYFIAGQRYKRLATHLLNVEEVEAPTSMIELMVRARKHMNSEDAMNAKKNKDGEDKRSDKKRPAPSTREESESKYKKFSSTQADRSSRRPVSPGKYNNYTPLNMFVEQVFLQIQDDASLKWPPKLKANPTKSFAGGGETSSAWRAHAGRIRNFLEVNDVGVTSPPTKLPRVEEPVINFSEEDDKVIHQPHDDFLVVFMVVANFTVRRILIDNGSSADILFLGVYSKLKIGREKLRPMKSPLVGFSGDKVYPLRVITLPVTAGANPKQVTVMVDFLVVDCPSSYNIILGRTTLNAMKAITFTYHLLMPFQTEYSMGELKGDQTMAREFYVASLRKTKSQEALMIEELEGRERQDFHRAKPTEELEEVILGDGEPEKKVSIGSLLPPSINNELSKFLKKNQDVIVWAHEDMPGIDPTIMEHRLNVNPNFKPIRQTRRTFTPERN